MKVVAQDGTPLPAEHLISSVNLRVEVQGTEFRDTFRLLAMRKLAAITLTLWKKGENFDADKLKSQAA